MRNRSKCIAGALAVGLVVIGTGCGEEVVRAEAPSSAAQNPSGPGEQGRQEAPTLIESDAVYLPVYRAEASIEAATENQRTDAAIESFEIWRSRSARQLSGGLPTNSEAVADLAESYGVDVETMSRLLEESGRQLEESGIDVPQPADLFNSVSASVYSEPIQFCKADSAISLFPVINGQPAILESSTQSEGVKTEEVSRSSADGGRVWVSRSPAEGFRTLSWIPSGYPSISISLTTSADCTAADAVDSIVVKEVKP